MNRSWAIVLCAAIVSFPQASVLANEARQVFDSLYGQKIKQAAATSDRADDIALAKDMLDVASKSKEHPALITLLSGAAHDLTSKHADGLATAVQAMQLLAEFVPDAKASAREKLIPLLTRQMAAGKPDEREQAGETLIDLLLTIGDEKIERKQYAEAAADYRRAMTVAQQRKSASVDVAKAKLEMAGSRERSVKQLARLQEKLLQDAQDNATAEEIIKLYAFQLGEPTAAVAYLNRAKDPDLLRYVTLAAKPVADISTDDCLALASWYKLAGDGAPPSQDKTLAWQAAIRYIDHFRRTYVGDDLPRKRADVMHDQLKQSLSASGIYTRTTRNLLALVDPDKDVVNGHWKRVDGALVSSKQRGARFALPVRLTGDYKLRVGFTRDQGDDSLVVVVPVGKTQVGVAIDSFKDEGSFSGLEQISGKRARDNETRLKGVLIRNAQRHTLEIDVSIEGNAANITAAMDGKTIVRWKGSQTLLDVNPQASVSDKQAIGFMAWDSVFIIHSVTITLKPGGEVTPVRE